MLFEFPNLAVMIVCVAMTAAYFVMLMPRWDLKLWAFFGVSVGFSAVQICLAVWIPCDWMYYGLIQCGLFDVGTLAHLLNGDRTVRDVVENK